MVKRYLECGKIVTTHGVKGELKVYPWTDAPEDFLAQKRLFLDRDGNDPVEIETARIQKNMVLLKLAGYDTPEAALRLRGRTLYLDRATERLAPGQYYIQDLIGLAVRDADDGHRYGELVDVTATGANDVYHIRFADGSVQLAPAIPQVVIRVDIEGGEILLRPLPGLFEDGGTDDAV